MSYNFFNFGLKNVLGNRLEIVLTIETEINQHPERTAPSLPPSLSPTHTHICPTL